MQQPICIVWEWTCGWVRSSVLIFYSPESFLWVELICLTPRIIHNFCSVGTSCKRSHKLLSESLHWKTHPHTSTSYPNEAWVIHDILTYYPPSKFVSVIWSKRSHFNKTGWIQLNKNSFCEKKQIYLYTQLDILYSKATNPLVFHPSSAHRLRYSSPRVSPVFTLAHVTPSPAVLTFARTNLVVEAIPDTSAEWTMALGAELNLSPPKKKVPSLEIMPS